MMMTTNHRWAISCFVALCLSISQAKLCAQRPFEESREGPEPVQRLRVNFSGGELSQYAELLRKEAPDFNIILTPEVMNFELGPIRLNNVSRWTAVNLVESLSDGDLSIDYQRDDNLAIINSNVAAGRVRVESIGDFILGENEERTDGGRVTLNDLLSAVQAALEFVRTPKPATLKIHPETGLFFVSGHPAQVDMVESVVHKLRSAHEEAQSSEVARLKQELKAKDRDWQMYLREKDDELRRLMRTLQDKEDQLSKLEERLREQRLKAVDSSPAK